MPWFNFYFICIKSSYSYFVIFIVNIKSFNFFIEFPLLSVKFLGRPEVLVTWLLPCPVCLWVTGSFIVILYPSFYLNSSFGFAPYEMLFIFLLFWAGIYYNFLPVFFCRAGSSTFLICFALFLYNGTNDKLLLSSGIYTYNFDFLEFTSTFCVFSSLIVLFNTFYFGVGVGDLFAYLLRFPFDY